MTNNDELAIKAESIITAMKSSHKDIQIYAPIMTWAEFEILLAERDADKKRIADLNGTIERECEKSRRMASRISELEARTVSVNSAVGCDACGGNGSVDIDHGELGVEHIECPKCAAAGIKLEVGE